MRGLVTRQFDHPFEARGIRLREDVHKKPSLGLVKVLATTLGDESIPMLNTRIRIEHDDAQADPFDQGTEQVIRVAIHFALLGRELMSIALADISAGTRARRHNDAIIMTSSNKPPTTFARLPQR